MSYLLDTNVVSELQRQRPEQSVVSWFETAPPISLYTSVLVVGEIRRGIEQLRRRDEAQTDRLETWLSHLKRDFSDRILPVTLRVAEAWGRLNASGPFPVVDGLLAATALTHGLTLVTRDKGALERTGVPLLDPWN